MLGSGVSPYIKWYQKSSMCIKHKYAKRNFLAEGSSVFILPKLWSSFCKASSDATSESGKGQSVLRNSPAKNTRMGCHFLLQGIFLTQGLNSSLLHCRQILYCLSRQGSPSLALRSYSIKVFLIFLNSHNYAIFILNHIQTCNTYNLSNEFCLYICTSWAEYAERKILNPCE